MKIIAFSIRTIFLLLALMASGLHIVGQNINYELTPHIPPTPQAVAFSHLGDFQVNNNYGMPNISIPLFEIDHHGYKIPLTLHYEASPLKPGYNYDVTGLGWTLSGNSCISRTIKDIADECAETPFTLDDFKYSSGTDREYLYYQYNNLLNKLNFQYDSYIIVLPTGRTIPFFMYKSDNIMQYKMISSDSNIKIDCHYSTNSIDDFTVTDENGIVYFFTLPEKATNIYQDDVNADRNVSWLLTCIYIPAKGAIYYEYTNPVDINTYNIIREPIVTVCRLYDSWGEFQNEKRFKLKASFQTQSPRYKMRLLKHIIYPPTTIDINYMDDNQHMKEIVVKDKGDTIRKIAFNVYGLPTLPNWQLNTLSISGQGDEDCLKYSFTYHNINNPGNYTDYWGNRCVAGPVAYNDYGVTINNYGLNDLGNFNLFFGYDGIGWDWSNVQQQLGYNGRLAQLIENDEEDHDYYWKLKLQTTTDGDTRKPTSPDKHGVLTSITYPNGGSTSFNWENHRFPTATAADGDIVVERRNQRIIEGGGFRIESIINRTPDGEVASEDYYRYGYTIGNIIHRNFPLPLPDSLVISNDTINHHIGCGEAVVDPNLFTFMSGFSYSMTLVPESTSVYSYAPPSEFRKMLIGQDSRFKNLSYHQNIQGIPMWWEVTFSANKFRSLIGGRRPVVYPEITVYHGHPYDHYKCKSKTVYKYDIYKSQFPEYYPIVNYLSSLNGTTATDTAYYEPLFFVDSYPSLSCNEYPASRHQLNTKSVYSCNNDTWELVSEEKYNYNKHQTSLSGYCFESFLSRENYYPNNGISYNQIGFSHPLLGIPLRAFYRPVTQWIGRSTMTKKSTTTLRQGGTQSKCNTLFESYNYKYPGVLTSRKYSDQLKYIHSVDYNKLDSCLYVGEEDEDSNPIISEMKSRNMLTSLVSTETHTLTNGYPATVLSGSRIEYDFYDEEIFPSILYEWNGSEYEGSVQVLSYGSYGNPTEILDLRTGIHSVFLWDNTSRYMIAMIKNGTLSQVGNVSQLRDCDSQSRYVTLHAKFPDSQIETWDYKPLVGISSHTDVGGQTTLYEYDGLGRLKAEKRIVNGSSEPELLHEYEYNYLNHPSF